jgi:hypothetical protein
MSRSVWYPLVDHPNRLRSLQPDFPFSSAGRLNRARNGAEYLRSVWRAHSARSGTLAVLFLLEILKEPPSNPVQALSAAEGPAVLVSGRASMSAVQSGSGEYDRWNTRRRASTLRCPLLPSLEGGPGMGLPHMGPRISRLERSDHLMATCPICADCTCRTRSRDSRRYGATPETCWPAENGQPRMPLVPRGRIPSARNTRIEKQNPCEDEAYIFGSPDNSVAFLSA